MADKLMTFVHISDTHIHADPAYTGQHIDFSSREPVQKLVEAINHLEPEIDFVMHTGDVADSPENADHYTAARDILSKLRYPVYYVPGNHDRVALFQQAFIEKPDYAICEHCDYQFTVNGVQVVMLDSHAPPDEDTATGYLAPEQLRWLDAICRADDPRPLVIGLHHHALPLEAPWLDRIMLRNGIELHETLRQAQDRLRGVFYGHIHESVVTVRDGISYYSVQSGWFQTRTWYAAESPARGHMPDPGYNLVTLTETDTFVRFRRVPL